MKDKTHNLFFQIVEDKLETKMAELKINIFGIKYLSDVEDIELKWTKAEPNVDCFKPFIIEVPNGFIEQLVSGVSMELIDLIIDIFLMKIYTELRLHPENFATHS